MRLITRLTTRNKVFGILGVLGICCSSALAADFAGYKVKKLEYYHEGAYTARPMLRWNTPSGRHCEVRVSGALGALSSAAIDLTRADKFAFPEATDKAACLTNGALPEGTEVWMRIKISAGETKSCRKDNSKFLYYKDGDTMTYYSTGTTTLNNRCQIWSEPKSEYILP
jgi:hypothetical protein